MRRMSVDGCATCQCGGRIVEMRRGELSPYSQPPRRHGRRRDMFKALPALAAVLITFVLVTPTVSLAATTALIG